MEKTFGVMMAGGASSRFFPENKVFSDPTGCGRSMVQQAYDRLTENIQAKPPAMGLDFANICCIGREQKHGEFLPSGNFYCVTGPDMADEMKQHLPDAKVLAEPGRRNTLPAILWTMAHVETHTPDGTLIVVTGDHVIGDIDIFRSALALAVEVTNMKSAIVTVGINPSKDANEWTAFGAIQNNKEIAYKEAQKILKFEEKPSLEQAKDMINMNCWAWNSGMFVFKIQLMRDMLQDFQPEIFSQYKKIVESLKANDIKSAEDAFLAIKPKMEDPRGTGKSVDTSIDYAIMMRLTHPEYKGNVEGFCIPGTFYWMDIGSWNALRTVCKPDSLNNVQVGKVTLEDSKDVIAYGAAKRDPLSDKVIDLVVKNSKGFIVVAGSGWVLICKEEMAQAVKQVREKALACNDAVVCEQCVGGAAGIEVSGENPPRIAAVGVTKAAISCSNEAITVVVE